VKSDARRYAIWLVAAAGLHAGLLFGPWKYLGQDAAYNMSPDEGIEVSLVDSAPGAPAEAAPAPVAPPAVAAVEPPPAPPPPIPEPTPPPPVPEAAPEPQKPPEKPEEPKEPEPKPHAERKPKASPAHANSSTPHPHAAPPSTTGQNTAAGAATGTSVAKGAGGSTGAGNSKPAYLSNPHPPYPPESKANHEQGLVMLAVSINESGDVTAVSVSQSSGYPRLDQSAREGVSHWRFRPARVAGFAVASHLAVPVRFRLSD
jgi:periplasmic protein TonB